MDKAREKVKLNDELLDQVSGGKGGSSQTLYDAVCPGCGHTYTVSDQTTQINCPCGASFYPTAR